MNEAFELFKTEEDGSVSWLGVITDIDSGERKARQLMKSSPGEYFVYGKMTGKKIFIKPDQVGLSTRRG